MTKAILHSALKKTNRTWKLHLLTLCAGFSVNLSLAQNHVLDVGIRLQKTVGLYYENGLTLQYSGDRLLAQRLYLGVSYVSSRLGTALGSNAIRQDNLLLSASFFFKPRRLLRPFIRANVGYFAADLEEEIFDDLPSASPLLSPEAGLYLVTKTPLKVGVSFGYNLITGDGVKGPGTFYPLFLQTSITWNLLHKKN
jgi:hypothetical protein